jgi:hypothetical protein
VRAEVGLESAVTDEAISLSENRAIVHLSDEVAEEHGLDVDEPGFDDSVADSG